MLDIKAAGKTFNVIVSGLCYCVCGQGARIEEMKTKLKVVAHIVVSMILVIIYFYFFGSESLRKFRAKAVIVTEHEEHHVDMPQPGILHIGVNTYYSKDN